MKTVKNNKFLLVIALTLVLSLTVGLTLSYFSDYENAKGGAAIALGNKTELWEDPGEGYKNLRIDNTGDTDVIVRVAVYAPAEVTYEGASGWTTDGDYIYYNEVIPAGESSSTIKATWKTKGDVGEAYDVVVVHESEQVIYDEYQKIIVPKDWIDVVNH